MWRVAFDIGGTFTDFVLAGADVPPRFLKVASSPDDPARAVVAGFGRLLAEAGVAAAELRTILHATTVATNAIIERKGCPTALLTTDGFRDVLIIGRQKRYETHDLYMTKPPPLVPRRRTFEVVERVDPHGGVEIPLDPVSLDAAIDAVIASGAESVAVSFLHAYANPAHEQAVAARLRERAPALPVSLSSKISPKPPEWCNRGSARAAEPMSGPPSNASAATSPARHSRTNASRSMTAGRSCIDSSTPSMTQPLMSCSTRGNSCGTSVCRTPSGQPPAVQIGNPADLASPASPPLKCRSRSELARSSRESSPISPPATPAASTTPAHRSMPRKRNPRPPHHRRCPDCARGSTTAPLRLASCVPRPPPPS